MLPVELAVRIGFLTVTILNQPNTTSAILRGHDPCFQPRTVLFFYLFSDILLLDDSPLLQD